MSSFGELIIEAREKASQKKSGEATVEAKDCSCSVTVSRFSEGSFFRQGVPVPLKDRPNNHGSTLEHYDPCAEHEFRPRVLAARAN
jgi:hypothetical protein